MPEKDFILKALLQVVGTMHRFDDLKEYQRFLHTNKVARSLIMEELRNKEDEYCLPDHERVSRPGRFFLSALPFIVGASENVKGSRSKMP